MYTCTCVDVYVCGCVCVRVYTCVHMHTWHVWVCMYVGVYVYKCVHMHTCTCVGMYVCGRVCVHICVRACVYVFPPQHILCSTHKTSFKHVSRGPRAIKHVMNVCMRVCIQFTCLCAYLGDAKTGVPSMAWRARSSSLSANGTTWRVHVLWKILTYGVRIALCVLEVEGLLVLVLACCHDGMLFILLLLLAKIMACALFLWQSSGDWWWDVLPRISSDPKVRL